MHGNCGAACEGCGRETTRAGRGASRLDECPVGRLSSNLPLFFAFFQQNKLKFDSSKKVQCFPLGVSIYFGIFFENHWSKFGYWCKFGYDLSRNFHFSKKFWILLNSYCFFRFFWILSFFWLVVLAGKTIWWFFQGARKAARFRWQHATRHVVLRRRGWRQIHLRPSSTAGTGQTYRKNLFTFLFLVGITLWLIFESVLDSFTQ